MYSSDLTNEQWCLLERLVQQHGPSHKVGELPRIHELRRVVDAILYANKTS